MFGWKRVQEPFFNKFLEKEQPARAAAPAGQKELDSMKSLSQKTITAPSQEGVCVVRNFREHFKNTLKAFFSLEIDNGLILHGLTLHKKNGSEWVGVPARQVEKNGVASWLPQIEFTNRDFRSVFQSRALAAVHRHLDGEGAERGGRDW
jgi:DNA-binding cell septation regulator SpoVG